MRQTQKQAFTLVELLVVIAIIGTLVGLLLPAVQAAREAARNNTCKNNLTQFVKALATRESSIGDLPGYINKLGISGAPAAQQQRASWVVMTFPYIEQRSLWDQWTLGFPASAAIADYFTGLEILVCASDPPLSPGDPNLSYVANAGFIANAGTTENAANGVFFDRTRYVSDTSTKGAAGPDDLRDSEPPIVMTIAYLQAKGDGTTKTIMLSENMNAIHWGYRIDNDRTMTSDNKVHFGFCWEQPAAINGALASPPSDPDPKNDSHLQFRRINGQKLADDAVDFDNMPLNDGFPSSNHPGTVNVAFVGGQVVGISDQVDNFVYGQLMTSNSKKSDLKDGGGNPESGLSEPSDSDY